MLKTITSIQKKPVHHIVDLTLATLYAHKVITQYRLYPWIDFPLGWDPVLNLSGALRAINEGLPLSLVTRGKLTVYNTAIASLGLIIDPWKVEAALPVILTIAFALLSSRLVYKHTNSNILAALSTFLTYYSTRNIYFASMFHNNLLAFVFIIYASTKMTGNFEDNHKWILTMLTTVAYTHLFTFVFLVLSTLIYYIRSIPQVVKHHLHNRKTTITIIIIFLTLLILNHQYIPFLYTGMATQSNLGGNYWFKAVTTRDYLLIYNSQWPTLAVITLSTIYTYLESKEKPALRLLSIFGIVSFTAPLLSLQFPGAIPPARITLLNQYQVIVPISAYLLANRISPHIKLPKIGNTEISKVHVASILLALLFLSQAPATIRAYDSMFRGNMAPKISEIVYSRLKQVKTTLEENNYPTPIVLLYCSQDLARVWSNYAYIALGDGYSYYGRYEDAVALTPPDELTYLTPHQYNRAVELYGNTERTGAENIERFTLVVLDSFYTLDREQIIDYIGRVHIKVIER